MKFPFASLLHQIFITISAVLKIGLSGGIVCCRRISHRYVYDDLRKAKKAILIGTKIYPVKARINYYLFLSALIVLDAVLLRSPNLLGKIGLIVYNYHYLRTFPKALLTVALVAGMASILAEVIRFIVKNGMMKQVMGRIVLFLFILASAVMLVKTAMDFTTWSYAHTGLRFRLGAYLLPAILVLIFMRAWFTLPKNEAKFPESPMVEDKEPESFIK